MTEPIEALFPTKRVGAGVLVTDAEGRILLVKPTYKDGWEIPGGLVEGGESPSEAAAREAREELGIEVAVGDVLVIQYAYGGTRWATDGVMFVFDGGEEIDASPIVLPADELSAWEFVDPEDLDGRVSEQLATRLRAAIAARHEGVLRYLER